MGTPSLTYRQLVAHTQLWMAFFPVFHGSFRRSLVRLPFVMVKRGETLLPKICRNQGNVETVANCGNA